MISILYFGCTEKKNNQTFSAVAPKNENSTKTWLRKAENYKTDKSYQTVLLKYYNQQLQDKKYLEASDVLDIACMYLADSYDFNDEVISVIKDYNLKYRSKVDAQKSTFVDSYLANFYFDKSDLKNAEIYFKKVTVVQPNDYNSCYNIARAYYDLSYVYYISGKQNLSLQANQKSFEYFTKINNPKGLAFVNSNYANIYTAIGDKKKAIECIDKAIKGYREIDNTYNVYINIVNKISLYDFMNDSRKFALIDSTYQAFTASKDKSKILKLKIHYLKIENLVNQNELLQAKKMIDDLKPLVNEINSDDLTLEYKVAIAQYEIKNNKNYADFNDIKKALPTLFTNQQYEKVNMFYAILQNNAIKNNDFKTAFVVEKNKRIVADSISDITTRQKVVELETVYQTQKKQQQIILQKAEILTKNTTIAILAFMFIVMLLSVIVYVTRQKQKKLKLEKENAQQYTKQLLEKTEEERKRIASDLHDSVSHELLSLKNSFEVKNDSTNTKIDAIINDIRIISINLHPILFDKIGLQASIEQLVERAQYNNDLMITAEIEYQNSLSVNDELQVYRIIQEAVSNIIKYANAMAAKIIILDKKDTIAIEIKDNGKGFNVSETLKGKNAFGLHNIIERSRAINGEAKIVSSVNGTVITIEIKKTV